MQFFHAAAQAHAGHLAAADGDQRVRELVALAQGVLHVPGVEVGKNALAPPGRGGNHGHKGQHHQCPHAKEHAGIDPAQKQNPHGDDDDHQKSAHVRLGQQQHANNQHGKRHGQHGTKEALFHRHAPHHVVGGVQKHGEFGQFGGLKIHHPQRQPAPRAIDGYAHVGDEHNHQQHQRQHENARGQLLPALHRNLKGQQGRHKAHAQRDGVAQGEVVGQYLAKARVVRHGNRGRIHHHQPPGQQANDHPNQRLVQAQRGRRQGFAAVLGIAHAHGQDIDGLVLRAAHPAGQACAPRAVRRGRSGLLGRVVRLLLGH